MRAPQFLLQDARKNAPNKLPRQRHLKTVSLTGSPKVHAWIGNNIEVNPSLYRIFATTDVHATTLFRRETSPHRTSSKHSSGGKPDLSGDLVDEVIGECLRHKAFDPFALFQLSRTRTMNLAGRPVVFDTRVFPQIIGKFAPLYNHAPFFLNA